MKDVVVIVGCDCDPDRPMYGGIQYNSMEKMVWRGITEGIPNAKEIANDFVDSYDKNPKFTLFVRSDEQINEIYDDYAFEYRGFFNLWHELKRDGDEIGWHPHLWRWTDEYKTWYQEIEDERWIERCLMGGYKAIPEEFKPLSVRMGWDFHNNFTMQTLDNLGIKCDLSALPGLRSEGAEVHQVIVDKYNWISSPKKPYKPCKTNYQVACNNMRALRITEIPLTTGNIALWLFILKTLLGRSRRRFYELNPTKHPVYTRNIIKKAFKTGYLVMYSHPDELLPEKGLFSYINFRKNFEIIAEMSKKYNLSYTYRTATEGAKRVLEQAP